jgi:hypothetical protein
MNKFSKIFSRIYSPVFRLVVFIALMSSGKACAKTQKTQEQATAMIWQRAIQLYMKSEGALPKSWEDLMRVEGSEYCVRIIDTDIVNFRSRYRFLESRKQIMIKIDEGERRVIGMGITTRTPGQDTLYSKDVRSVILSSNDGNVEHATLSEIELESAFREAGANLSDYTGSGGKWEPEPKNGDDESDAVKVRDDSKIKKLSPTSPDSKQNNYLRNEPIKVQNSLAKYGMWFGSLIVLLAVIISWKIRKSGR